jgi:hypothetical protein
MTTKTIVMTIAVLLGATPAALAQSAYTSGTADSSIAAGYPNPYGGVGVYDYAPNYGYAHGVHRGWRYR